MVKLISPAGTLVQVPEALSDRLLASGFKPEQEQEKEQEQAPKATNSKGRGRGGRSA